MERHRSGSAVRAVLALLAIAALLAPIFVLRALPTADLTASDLGWVTSALAAGLLVAAGIATVAALVTGLRRGSLASLLMAGGMAALVGGSVGFFTGSATIALPITAAGGLVLATSVADRLGTLVPGRGARIATACLLLVAAEAVVVAELLPPVAAAIGPYRSSVLVAGAILGGLASIVAVTRDLGPAAAALAVGATALAVARVDGAELSLGLVALIGGALLTARSSIGADDVATEPDRDPLPAIAMQLSEGVLRFDGHLRLQSWNPAAARLIGLDDASAGGRLEDLIGVSLTQLPAGAEAVLCRTPTGGLDLSVHRDANAITVVVHDPATSPEADRLGRELRGTIEELFQARRTIALQRAELERAMSTDPLTGVASRSAILDRLRTEVAQARRYQHPVAVVLLDVDRFAEINTAHGIESGDAVLREVALRVRLRVRVADAIGRSGSDALLAILPHTDEGGAATFADALRQRMSQRPIVVSRAEVGVTLSVGVAVMRPGEDLDLDELMARAEEALASARGAGGDRIALDRLHGLARLEAKRSALHDQPSVPDEGATDEGA